PSSHLHSFPTRRSSDLIQTEFGDVMIEPMLERSGHTAYADLAHRVAVVTRKSYQSGEASPPSVISQLIRHVLRVRNPRPRYAAGDRKSTRLNSSHVKIS